jgi:cell division protease FtsH
MSAHSSSTPPPDPHKRSRRIRWRHVLTWQLGVGIVLLLTASLFWFLAATGSPHHATPATAATGAVGASTNPRQLTYETVLSDITAGGVAGAVLNQQDGEITIVDTHGAYSIAAVPPSAADTLVSTLLAHHVSYQATPAAGAASTGGTITAAGTGSHTRSGAAPVTSSPGGSGGNVWEPLGVVCTFFSVLFLALGVIKTRRRIVHGHDVPMFAATMTGAPRGGATRGGATRGNAAVRHRSKSRFDVVDRPDTRFSDVAGADEAVEELDDLVTFLRDPERFTRLGAQVAKGALLYGPPGTGKTLLARALAGEAGVPFITAAGSDMTEMYVGVGAARIRELFSTARSAAAENGHGAIVFIDEIDAIARRRGAEGEGGNGETEATLNALLVEMDGFAADNVIVVAATNRKDMLDPAILRPGRLGRHIAVPNPDVRGREHILGVHSARTTLADGVDLGVIAMRTAGFSGAQLKEVVNIAATDAAKAGSDFVHEVHLHQAVETVAMGRPRVSALVTEHDARVTAWHEGGHTLCALLQPEADDPIAVSIVPRGPAGGVTWMAGNDDVFLPRRKAHAQLVTALGGRAAEELLMDGEFTQGAMGDLQSATELATRMISEYGMSRLGHQVRRSRNGSSTEVQEVVDELLDEAYESAKMLLTAHLPLLAELADELLVRKNLYLTDVEVLAERHGARRHERILPVPALPRPRVSA